ncbi:hypothetical protein C0J52_03208 [Blattella germanica]|nr:hypothetical protein C0J52_03208 [Blattella germanica]
MLSVTSVLQQQTRPRQHVCITRGAVVLEMGELLKKTLRSILAEEGIDPDSPYELQDNDLGLWMTSVCKVPVHVDYGCDKKLFLFFKCLSENPDLRETLDTEIFFKNEVAFYNEVLSSFLRFQEKRNVKTPFRALPKCYKAQSDGERDVIVLEDLKAKGFVMLDRLRVMNISELQILMKELGRFHALSLAMKDQEPASFENIRNALKETVFCKRFLKKFGQLYEFVINDALKMVKHNFPDDSKYLTKLKQGGENICDKMMELVRPKEEDEPYNVITHGDLWVSNFMFRYSDLKEESSCCGAPDEMKILDFQVSRYASPALDVSYVLLSSADRVTREVHQRSFLHTYHESLSDSLIQLGSDPKELFPFSKLEEQLRKYSRFGLWLTLFNLPHTLDEGESIEVHKLESSDEILQEDADSQVNTAINAVYSRKSEQCQERILDAIKYVVDNGYLD